MPEEFAQERMRCTDRLRTMPLAKLPQAADLAFAASLAIVGLTPIANAHQLPRLADRAAGDQLDVVAGELLAADPDAATLTAATDILTRLRRSLP